MHDDSDLMKWTLESQWSGRASVFQRADHDVQLRCGEPAVDEGGRSVFCEQAHRRCGGELFLRPVWAAIDV